MVVFARDDDKWAEYSDESIEKFIKTPSIPVLCVYKIECEIIVEHAIPTKSMNHLAYFIRDPNEIFHVENFLNDILFGTFNGNIENLILRTVNNVFAPVFFKIQTWPDSILCEKKNK